MLIIPLHDNALRLVSNNGHTEVVNLLQNYDTKKKNLSEKVDVGVSEEGDRYKITIDIKKGR